MPRKIVSYICASANAEKVIPEEGLLLGLKPSAKSFPLGSILIVFVLLLLVRYESGGQHLTPLYQYMVTNSPVVLAEELRTFRDKLDEEIGKTSPGLKVDQLYAKMSSMRMEVNELMAQATVSYSGTNIIIRMPGLDNDTIPYNVNELAENLTAAKFSASLRGTYSQMLRKVLAGSLNALSRNESRNALNFVLREVLENYGVPRIDANSDDQSAKLLNDVIIVLDSMLVDLTIQSIREIDKGFLFDVNKGINKLKGESVARAINLAFDRLRQTVDQAMDRAEHAVTSVADAFSNLLIAGNVGIAFTSGSGTLSGGVLVSWQPPEWTFIQLGAFTNAVAGALDETEPGFGLSGLQLRLTVYDIQAEIYYGAYYGNHKHFRDFRSSEMGGGVSCNINHSVTLGGAFFRTEFADAPQLTTFSAALSVGFASPDSPTLFLGAVQQENGKLKPAVHLAYPIQPSL